MRWCKCLSCPKSEVEDVTTLDFSCSALTEVPPIVFNFERTLETLHLDYNKITELPRTLFQCEELCYLGLSDNEIETLPPLVDKLTNLESLLLSRNCLGFESIPSNLHRCQKLKVLHLSSNSLTKMPSPITRLVALKELYLNNCDLEFLPANFGRLHNLRILELRENHLTTLPKSLKRLSDLRRLDLSSNMLKKFPEVIGTMTNLTELWLNDNFVSEVPDSVGNLHKLSHFDISCNRLEKVTNNIGLCSCMTLLLLSMNDLKELPRAIANLPLLHTLKVDHNLLETLPLNIGKLSNLEELDVQFNNLKSFPNSIGMLRKLSSLVASQNSISFLPTEIGSCISLSVLSLHYNVLMYLPEEIGHLQKLTSISLINNRLRYLPITVLSLQKLKALWLSHNQSQPLITLQKDVLESGQVVLTCVFLPQMEMPLQIPETTEAVVPSGRKIGFMEPNMSNDLPAKLNRIPTPHPKAFVKYQRTLENTLRRNQESIPQSISVDAVYVKEASIKPMKNASDETDAIQVPLMQDVETVSYSHHKRPLEFVEEPQENIYYDSIKKHELDLGSQNNDESEYIPSVGSICTTTSLENGMSNLQIDENLYNVSIKSSISNEKELSYEALQTHMLSMKPKQPPPYHIAAAYSRDAHLFVNSSEKSENELEPKHFTQDQPSNILNPQPKHAQCQMDFKNSNQTDGGGGFENGNYNENIEINIRILQITTALLKIDAHNPISRNIFDKFVKLSNLVDEIQNSSDILNLKLKILKTTESLLCSQDYISLNKKFIMQGLEQIQENLVGCHSLMEKFLDSNENDVEFKEKLILIDIVASLLDLDGENYEFWDIFNQILQIEKVLPQNHQVELTKIVRNRCFLQAKIILLKMAIHFLTAKTIDKEYKYNLGRFMQLQRRLHYNMRNSNLNGFLEKNNANLSCNRSGQKHQNANWLFGVHRNPKIIKIELTPCCYVLGFSISHNEEGVFVNEVDKNGNAFQKLFTGDKILMLDDRDVSKMNPEDALKAVQMWGPETEVFLISRS